MDSSEKLHPFRATLHHVRAIPAVQFAKLCGVSRGAIQKAATKSTGKLRGSYQVVDHIGVIDADHPNAQAYYRGHTSRELTDVAPDAPPARVINVAGADEPLPEDIGPYLDLTLREVIGQYGTVERLMTWLEAGLKISKIHKTQFEIHCKRGNLIDRQVVRAHVIGPLDDAMARLLHEVPVACASLIRDAVESGEPDEELIRIVRVRMAAQIKNTKRDMQNGLRRATDRARKAPGAITDPDD